MQNFPQKRLFLPIYPTFFALLFDTDTFKLEVFKSSIGHRLQIKNFHIRLDFGYFCPVASFKSVARRQAEPWILGTAHDLRQIGQNRFGVEPDVQNVQTQKVV